MVDSLRLFQKQITVAKGQKMACDVCSDFDTGILPITDVRDQIFAPGYITLFIIGYYVPIEAGKERATTGNSGGLHC